MEDGTGSSMRGERLQSGAIVEEVREINQKVLVARLPSPSNACRQG